MSRPYLHTPFDLSERVALITGGGVGIGAASAKLLAQAGARVAVHYRTSEAEAAATVAEIVAAGGSAVSVRGDLSSEADCTRIVDEPSPPSAVSTSCSTTRGTRSHGRASPTAPPTSGDARST